MTATAVAGPQAVASLPENYSPQQLQQLDALASAHRIAYQHFVNQGQQGNASNEITMPMGSPSAFPPACLLPPNEQRLVNLIATLSSQHHLSDYTKLKLGSGGFAPPYIPLSITVPTHVEELRQRQAVNVAQSSVFLAPRQATANSTEATAFSEKLTPKQESPNQSTLPHGERILESQVLLPHANASSEVATTQPFPLLRSHSAPALNPPTSPLLQLALNQALSSQLVLPPSPATILLQQAQPSLSRSPLHPLTLPPHTFHPAIAAPPASTPKTSESHPINISYLIPPEYIPFISSHLNNTYPHVFGGPDCPQSDANPSDKVSQFGLPPHLRFDGFLHHNQSIGPSPPLPSTPSQSNSHPHSPTISRSNLSPRLAAQRSQSRADDRPWPIKSLRRSSVSKSRPSSTGFTPAVTFSSTEADIQQAIADALLPFKIDSSPTLEDSLPRSPSVRSLNSMTDEAPLAILPFPLTQAVNAAQEAVATPPPPPSCVPGYFDMSPPMPTSPPAVPPVPQVGNLLLSSCPGKKVRLSGPVKGRGAICRSLPQDLARIRSLGVGLLINCLDDVELEFLGAPWSQYVESANSLGLDVLRLPTPEGLAPLSTTRLDDQLNWVIKEYTLKGANVLVHCRGGVGRAGLVACCWMMKMGLCGPVDESVVATPIGSTSMVRSLTWPMLIEQGLVRSETFSLVQKVVTTIRRRRSVKAIETYEQARFLFDFAEHLRDCQVQDIGGVGSCKELTTLTLPTDLDRERERSPVPSIGQMSVATTDNNTLVEGEGEEASMADEAAVPAQLNCEGVIVGSLELSTPRMEA